jgi:hypothetical protein
MLLLIRRSCLFTQPYERRASCIPFEYEDEGQLRSIPLQQEFQEFYQTIKGMQYEHHIRSYLFKKHLIELISAKKIYVKDWIVSKGQLQF